MKSGRRASKGASMLARGRNKAAKYARLAAKAKAARKPRRRK
jgi:hypothetical protein